MFVQVADSMYKRLVSPVFLLVLRNDGECKIIESGWLWLIIMVRIVYLLCFFLLLFNWYGVYISNI